ncbi:hypothetical protein EDB89DRAFT_2029724 [Lactarius sanguifluus]|nr:hypothetical protein EDB89DRAFT_2029724 [Lactarius sanguifluus]
MRPCWSGTVALQSMWAITVGARGRCILRLSVDEAASMSTTHNTTSQVIATTFSGLNISTVGLAGHLITHLNGINVPVH